MPSRKPTDAGLSAGVRDQIVAAASTEFAAKGLGAASVRSIAGRAGATAAMINYYFGGKRGLYDVVVERAQRQLFATIRGVLDGDGGDLPARLAGAYFDFLSHERELQKLLLREVLDEGDSVAGLVRKYVEPLRAMFDEQFGTGDDVFHAVVSVFGAVAGYFLYAPVLAPLMSRDPLSPDALEQRRRHVMTLASLMTQSLE